MIKRLFIPWVILGFAACGGTATPFPNIGSPSSSSSTSTETLTATMTSTGVGTPGSWTITQAGQLIIPSLTNFTVLQDTTEAWQVNLLINGGTQSCNFSHTAGTSTISAGTGCSVSTSYMTVAVGDIVTLSISSGVTQTASVKVSLSENN
jgi:hypothetical protein